MASFRVRDIVVGAVLAGAAGGAAVWVFVGLCGMWQLTAEVSGQVAVGTIVYALVQKGADAVLVRRHLRDLRRRLATLLDYYVCNARARTEKPRNASLLKQDIAEFRDAASVAERDKLDAALSELLSHGDSKVFSNLDDNASLEAITTLARTLG